MKNTIVQKADIDNVLTIKVATQKRHKKGLETTTTQIL